MEDIRKAINIINSYNKGDKAIKESTAIGYFLLANKLSRINKIIVKIPIPKR